MAEHRRVAVIGAGAAGCMAAWTLKQRGHEVAVFEKHPEIGGRTRTFRKDGAFIDVGAAFVTNFYPRMFSLLDELGIRDELVALNRISTLVKEGEPYDLDIGSVRSFFGIPFLSFREKLRMLRSTLGLTLRRGSLDVARPEVLQHHDSQSIAEYARERLGENLYNILVRTSIEPFWYFSCEEVSWGLAKALTAHAANARFYYFRSGIDMICRTLIQAVDLVPAADVKRVTRGSEGGLRMSWEQEGQLQARDFDQVVVATTASFADSITQELPEELVSNAQRAFLQSQRYVANTRASFVVPRFDHQVLGSSVFPCGEGNNDLAAVLFQDGKTAIEGRDDVEIITAYMARDKSRALLDASEAAIRTECLRVARQVYPAIPEHTEPFHQIAREEAIPIHAVGRYKLASDFKAGQAAPVVFAGDYLGTATVEGALVSGEDAALALLGERPMS